MKNRRYINSYASTAAIINLQSQIDDIRAGGSGAGNAATWAQTGNTDLIPDSKISETFAKSADLAMKADLVDGKVPVEQLPATTAGIVVGEGDNDAFAGSRGVALETKVTDLEATVSDKLGVDDVAVWAKSEDPTLIPVNKLDDHAVKYSDFVYTPSGEETPVTRKTIQLANYDSISGMNVAGNDAANLIMMSKWDKVDIGSSRYPVNLNGSEFTLNDEKHIATVDQIPDVSNFATKEEIPSVEGLASTEYVDQKVAEIEVPDVSDLKANVQTVGESVQIGQETKGINLKTSGDTYSGAMINSFGYIPTMTPYPGEDGRYVLQMRNHDSLSGVGTDGVTGGNLAMISKWDVADFGSKNFHTNLNVKADNGHDGRVTVNDDNEVAYLTDIPEVIEFAGLTDLGTGSASASIRAAIGLEFADLVDTIRQNKAIFMDRNAAGDYKTCIRATGNISSGNGGANLMFMVGTVPTIYEVQYVNNEWALYVAEYEFAKKSDLEAYATTQNVSDSIAAEASARDKAIETATSDLVHNTLTVAGKSLTENITLASTDLTDGAELAKKDEILNTVVDESRNETLRQSLTARTYLPFARNSDLTNQTEAQIFALFSNNVTDRASLREYLQSNMAYISYNLDSLGEHQYYKSTILMASVPNDGDITVIAIAADIYNGDKLSKFTYTITLNGDASSVHIEKKALES